MFVVAQFIAPLSLVRWVERAKPITVNLVVRHPDRRAFSLVGGVFSCWRGFLLLEGFSLVGGVFSCWKGFLLLEGFVTPIHSKSRLETLPQEVASTEDRPPTPQLCHPPTQPTPVGSISVSE